jgi:hypothetical protein
MSGSWLPCFRPLRISPLDEELRGSGDATGGPSRRTEEVFKKDTMRIEDEVADIMQCLLSLLLKADYE